MKSVQIFFIFILLGCTGTTWCQNPFEIALKNQIDSLSTQPESPYEGFMLYPTDAVQGIMIPSGWSSYGTYIYGSLGGAYPQVYSNLADLAASAGFGFGNPETFLSFAAGLTMSNVSDFNNFSANVSISKILSTSSSITVGSFGLFASRALSDAPEASYYVAFSHAVQSLPSKTLYRSKLSYTVGIGNGRFLLKSQSDIDAGKGKYGTAVFGGISYELFRNINVNAEWTGLNLGVSLGAQPFKTPLSIGIGVTNLTKYSADKPNMLFVAGYALSLNKEK